ncbi:MAG: hypothetical protein ACI4T3_04705 [Lactobacillus sp.]
MNDIRLSKQDHKLILPTQPEYRHWSKTLVKERVENDPVIRDITVHDDKYHFCPSTIAIYDFHDEPLLGKYETVIIDTEQGIILCKKPTRSMLHRYSTKVMLSGLSLQKIVARSIGLLSYHSLSLVHLVFFSMHTYTNHNTDWVGLHFFRDFVISDNVIRFVSITIEGYIFVFSFDHHNPCLHQRIKESLVHNATLSYRAHDYHDSIAWACDRTSHKSGSIIFNQNFLPQSRCLIMPSLKHIIDQMVHDWHYIYMKHIADEYDMSYLIEDHSFFYRAVQRKRQNY